MEKEHEDEVPEGRRLAEQGNTDAKLFVADDSEENDKSDDDNGEAA